MTGLGDVGDLARQSRREQAACNGSPHDVIDVTDLELAEYLIQQYCHRCEVLSACAEYGDSLRPEKWTADTGGRLLWGKRSDKACFMTARYGDRCGALPRGVGGSIGCPRSCPGPWQRIAERFEHLEHLVTEAIHWKEQRP